MNYNMIGRTKVVRTGPMKPWQAILFGLVFVVVGIVLIFFSFNSLNSYNEKNASFIEIPATIVDYNQNDEGLYAIIAEYYVDGQSYRKISNSYSSMPKKIGTEINIKYNPINPNDAIWVDDSSNIILPVMGVLFTIAGAFVVIKSLKNKDSQFTSQTITY